MGILDETTSPAIPCELAVAQDTVGIVSSPEAVSEPFLPPSKESKPRLKQSFSEDPSRFEFYEHSAGYPKGSNLNLQLFEWNKGELSGHAIPALKTVFELKERKPCSLRIVCAPLHIAHHTTVEGFMELFEHYDFPSAFISERLQSVAHSFGTRKQGDGVQCSWFHFLAKNIPVVPVEGGGIKIKERNPLPPEEKPEPQPASKTSAFFRPLFPKRPSRPTIDPDLPQSQADHSWFRSAFYLRTETALAAPNLSRSSSGSSDATLAQPGEVVTLFCFGAPPCIVGRFKRLAERVGCDDVLADPYMLFDIILDELYMFVDNLAWTLSDVFGDTEKSIIGNAEQPGLAATAIDFSGLHNVAKHSIYLLEACDAVLQTVESMRAHHERTLPVNLLTSQPTLGGGTTAAVSANPVFAETQNLLRYRKTLFQSTRMRLGSLDRRMQNVIQLSFNLTTQHDSRTMQRDSKSMRTIAAVTLVFLPLSTVAAIFGSQFFGLADSSSSSSSSPSSANPSGDNSGAGSAGGGASKGGPKLVVSPQFWILWAVSVPLTLAVVGAWQVWYQRQRTALMEAKRTGLRRGTMAVAGLGRGAGAGV